MTRPLVYIISPLGRGNISDNLRRVRDAAHAVHLSGGIPIYTHEYAVGWQTMLLVDYSEKEAVRDAVTLMLRCDIVLALHVLKKGGTAEELLAAQLAGKSIATLSDLGTKIRRHHEQR